MSEQQTKLRTQSGRVISDKAQKTVTVLVERRVKHPIYGKYITRSSKIAAHDEAQVAKEGDLVSITPCRPMSRRKSWKVVEVIRSAP